MKKVKSFIGLIPMISLILTFSLTPIAHATAIFDPRMLPTEAELRFVGKASVSDSISVSQDIQIKPLTSDFGPAPLNLGTQGANQPIRWTVSFEDPTGTSLASVSLDYLQDGHTTFTFRQAQTDAQRASSPSVNCANPMRECVTTLSTWNVADPMRVSFGPDQLQGKHWWRATVLDLVSGILIDLGSLQNLSLTSIPILVVSDGISRNSLATDCPGDSAPVADTYFGPIVDSSGVEDLYPVPNLTTHDCVNAKFGLAYSYTGAYLLYGGTHSAQTSAPREYSFTPSSLIPSALPPMPDPPSNLSFTAFDGILTLLIQVPNFSTQGIKNVFLVSPELGFPKSTPLYSKALGVTTQFTIAITKQFLGNSIHLTFFTQTSSEQSNPYVEVITIPFTALDAPSASPTPAPQKSTKPTPKSTSKVTPKPAPKLTKKPTAKPTIKPSAQATASPTSTSPGPVPAPVQNLTITVVKSLLLIRAESNQRAGTPVTGCLLVAPLFNGGSNSPIVGNHGQLNGNTVLFAIQLNSSNAGAVFNYSLSLYNDSGASTAVSGTFKLPAVISN